jgi:hypothetical protein
MHVMSRYTLPALATAAIALTAAIVNAQPPAEPQRPPLRQDLNAAGEHLMAHPHPYTMSEEVARTRLLKQGLNPTEIKPLDRNRFEAQVLQNGQPTKVEIDRLNGAVRRLQ